MTNPHDFRVGDYRVWFDPPPIPTRNCDWHFQHKDDAGEVGRSGDGPTAQDCLVQIVELLSEELDTARGANRALRRFRDELQKANSDYLERFRQAVASANRVARTHVVQPGDTLSGIGEKYGVPWKRLALLNKLKNPHLIYPGQIILLELRR